MRRYPPDLISVLTRDGMRGRADPALSWGSNCHLRGMSQPVKLSDELLLAARLTSAVAHRSIASQIEFWAGPGRAVEVLLRSPELAATLHQVGTTARSPKRWPPRHRRRRSVGDGVPAIAICPLRTRPNAPSPLLRIDEDGTQTVSRFVNGGRQRARGSTLVLPSIKGTTPLDLLRVFGKTL